MKVSSATVITVNSSRYLQQLCKHWSHKFAVHFDETAGEIILSDDQRVNLSSFSDRLIVTVTVSENEDIDSTQKVVADHISRFAFRETLDFNWLRQE